MGKAGGGGGVGGSCPLAPPLWSPYQFSKFVFVVCKVLYIKAFGTEIFV